MLILDFICQPGAVIPSEILKDSFLWCLERPLAKVMQTGYGKFLFVSY